MVKRWFIPLCVPRPRTAAVEVMMIIKMAENRFRMTPDIKLKSVKCKKLSKELRKEIKEFD